MIRNSYTITFENLSFLWVAFLFNRNSPLSQQSQIFSYVVTKHHTAALRKTSYSRSQLAATVCWIEMNYVRGRPAVRVSDYVYIWRSLSDTQTPPINRRTRPLIREHYKISRKYSTLKNDKQTTRQASTVLHLRWGAIAGLGENKVSSSVSVFLPCWIE